MTISKSEILDNIKSIYGFKTDVQLGKKLGIKTQTISTWRTRDTFDIELIYLKCELIDGNYLLSGKGQILRSKNKQINVNVILNYIKENSEDLETNVNWNNFIENIELKAQKKLLIKLNLDYKSKT
ncbi:helix-turn-helix domain-containing protein [Tenacibaculum maritimum]|uniref:helix-turn-helix domain-containing protein n=1 Tax=Tenacibaculum maritimum TaxID=107401 RepID=UPI0038766B77